MKKSFYCVLIDEDNKEFDVSNVVSNDIDFYNSISVANKEGRNLKGCTVDCDRIKSRNDLINDNDPEGYKYSQGLFEKYNISKY